MKFSNITESLKKTISLHLTSIIDTNDILDVAFIEGNEPFFDDHILYFGYYEQLCDLTVLPPQCILACNLLNLPIFKDTDIALVSNAQLFPAFNMTKKILDKTIRMNLSTLLINSIATSKSIDTFMNTAATQLGNSLILLDTDFKVLSYSTVFPIHDLLWLQNIKQGFCNYEFVSIVKEIDSVKNSPNTSSPIEVNCPESQLRKLSSKVLHNGEKIAILVMLEKETKISPLLMEQLEIISIATSSVLIHYVPYLLPNKNQYQRLLHHLLIGAPPKTVVNQIESLSFPQEMNVIILQEARYLGQKHLKEQVITKLKSLLPNSCLILHGSCIAGFIPNIILAESEAATIEKLNCFCKDEFVKMGISNIFSNIESFAKYYNQASNALYLSEYLHDKNTVIKYLDYQFFDLLDHFGDKNNLGTFCHPALGILNRYDQLNGTELYHTLKTYLFCLCSIKKTAETLYIHRNSLTYRLERICDLAHINLFDSNVKFLLELSYKIDEFNGHG